MSRQSLTKAHAKITERSWEPTFATPATRFGTDYTFEKAPKKDPLKQIMRCYFPMQEEKDNRVYGAIRGNMFRQVQQRRLEWQKAGTIGRQFGEGFITGDAITAANIYLTVVAETAFTNTLFVAMPDEAAANGDYLLPTGFHSEYRANATEVA
jgi:Methane/Phenol/Alkene Hydroxylase